LTQDIDVSHIAAVLFDKDGTLIGYDASWGPVNHEIGRIASRGDEALAKKLLTACGMNVETGEIVADSLLAAGTAAEIAKGLIAHGADFDLAPLTLLLDHLFTEAAGDSVPVTDLKAFFTRLKARGYRLGIASSDNEASIRELARRFDFADLLDYVAGYDSGHGGKPGPGMVLGFCKAIGVEPQAVAVVGDNNHDLHMGKSAGAGLRVGVLTGTGSRASLSADAHYCLDSIRALEAILPAQAAG
jgi:phosphoglycolate phosphatase